MNNNLDNQQKEKKNYLIQKRTDEEEYQKYLKQDIDDSFSDKELDLNNINEYNSNFINSNKKNEKSKEDINNIDQNLNQNEVSLIFIIKGFKF